MPTTLSPRAAWLLEGIDVDRLAGLEIGPLDKPLLPRRPAVQTFVADYADRAALQDRSRGDPNVDIDVIPEIDFIISPLPASLGRRFGYILASHVLEHVPDLIGWIATVGSWLEPGGTLVLAIPDRRFTFDCTRAPSTVGQLIEAYLERRERPPVAAIYDGFREAVDVDRWYLWERVTPPRPFPHKFSREVALSLARKSHAERSYCDCHCWVFTAAEFRAALEEVRALGLLDFEWVRFVEPSRYADEFLATLRVNPPPPRNA